MSERMSHDRWSDFLAAKQTLRVIESRLAGLYALREYVQEQIILQEAKEKGGDAK